MASVCRGWKAVSVSHLRHPPALWQDLSVQPLCTALFNSFRCLSADSCAHPWDCCLHETLAHCPEPGVRMLVQHCAAFSLLLQCHHPPDCASCATVLGNIFTAVHLLPLGVLVFYFFSQCFSCQWKFFSSLSFPWGWLVYLWIRCCASSRGKKATLGQPHCWLCCSTGHTLNLENCVSWNNSLSWSFMPSPSLGPKHHFGYEDWLGDNNSQQVSLFPRTLPGHLASHMTSHLRRGFWSRP